MDDERAGLPQVAPPVARTGPETAPARVSNALTHIPASGAALLGTLDDVARPAPVLDAGTPLSVVSEMLQAADDITSVVVPTASGVLGLLSRRAVDDHLARHGEHHPAQSACIAQELAESDVLQLSRHVDTATAVALALDRPPEQRYQDLLVADEGAPPRVAVVADVVSRLAGGFHLLSAGDPLTGLGNRIALARKAELLLEADVPLGLLLLDLDRFKEVNDALGHAAGDTLLCEVARVLEASVGERGQVMRLGGDEFAILVPLAAPGTASAPDGSAHRLTELGRRILDELNQPYQLGAATVRVEGSVGVAFSPEQGSDLSTLLRRADSAMYVAKRVRSGVMVWSERQVEVAPSTLTLLSELRGAGLRGELRLHYQPLVDAVSGVVQGVEALVRWQHPSRGLLAPGVFVPMAERSEVIVELTDWVLGEALRQTQVWTAQGRRLPISVNLSARLLSDDSLVGRVARALEQYAVEPGLLTLEVTESAVMGSPAQAAAQLGALHALGVRVSLDDFGTGQTSLAMLGQLPVDELKVDRVFVRGLGETRAESAVVHVVVQLAHLLGLSVVAEGVEDAFAAQKLRDLGYDRLQGFHFSPPVPAERLLPRHARSGPALPRARRTARNPLPPVGPNEQARLEALHATAILDTPAESFYDDIVALASYVCGTPIALVSLVDEHRQWFKASVGLEVEQTPREQAFCAHTVARGQLLEVRDAAADLRFAANPLVVGAPGIRFYAGAPLLVGDGLAVGSLCVIDTEPRQLDPAQRDALERLARLVADRLEARRTVAQFELEVSPSAGPLAELEAAGAGAAPGQGDGVTPSAAPDPAPLVRPASRSA